MLSLREFPRGQTIIVLDAPAGLMEIIVDVPPGEIRGLAVIAHPNPTLGGSAKHKIPELLVRELGAGGWLGVRPNFRGAGRSAGGHDFGNGEGNDLAWLAQELQAHHPHLPLALVGFSFGAFVVARAASSLAAANNAPFGVALIALPVGEVAGGRHYEPVDLIPGTLIVHGEHDEIAPLKAVFDQCHRFEQAVVVVPRADHFFTGHLPLLRKLVASHLSHILDSSPSKHGVAD
jgi:alpha/beta superfamily hydrolase